VMADAGLRHLANETMMAPGSFVEPPSLAFTARSQVPAMMGLVSLH
jgi:hypothetical protein